MDSDDEEEEPYWMSPHLQVILKTPCHEMCELVPLDRVTPAHHAVAKLLLTIVPPKPVLQGLKKNKKEAVIKMTDEKQRAAMAAWTNRRLERDCFKLML